MSKLGKKLIVAVKEAIEMVRIKPISWREEAAARLDDACAIDTSATDINREPKPWWRTS